MKRKVFFSIIIVILIGVAVFYFARRPHMEFIQDEIHLGLYDEVKPFDYIAEVNHMNIKEIKETNNVNTEKLGKYQIRYTYQDKTFVLNVYIDDKMPPQFETINTKILRNGSVDPETLVKNIQDDSKTKVYFKEDYLFNELKTYRVIVVVEDSYGNKTEKNAYVLVEDKDVEAPTIKGIEKLTVLQGEDINLKEGVVVKDDHDKNPTLAIDDSALNLSEVGEYEVTYRVKDDVGNEEVFIRKVEVLSRYGNREAVADGIKTCYLTFDDGPSYNTKKILKILGEYNIKATFFVTGNSPKDYPYIKEAYKQGHKIGLHTYSHNYENIYSSLKNYITDLNQIKEVVYEQTGEYSKIIRFPGGSSNMISKKYNEGVMKRLSKRVIDLGYQYYDWSCITGDGESNKTVNSIKKTAIEGVQDKEDIMFLMHDSVSCDTTVKALPSILDYLIKKGYQFKVIDENSPTFHHTIQN